MNMLHGRGPRSGGEGVCSGGSRGGLQGAVLQGGPGTEGMYVVQALFIHIYIIYVRMYVRMYCVHLSHCEYSVKCV